MKGRDSCRDSTYAIYVCMHNGCYTHLNMNNGTQNKYLICISVHVAVWFAVKPSTNKEVIIIKSYWLLCTGVFNY